MPSPPLTKAYEYTLAGEIDLARARSTDAEQQFVASLGPYPTLSHQGLAQGLRGWKDAPAPQWKSFLDSRGEVFQDDCPRIGCGPNCFLAPV